MGSSLFQALDSFAISTVARFVAHNELPFPDCFSNLLY
jgi:hypothetical protein